MSRNIYLETFPAKFNNINSKRPRLVGVASVANKLNANGRIYPLNELQKAANQLQELINNGSPPLCLLDHPKDTADTLLSNACCKLTSVFMSGNVMMFEADILNTRAGQDLLSMLKDGVKVSVSTRGLGELNGNTVTNYSIASIDIVSNPSCQDATATLVESRQLNEAKSKLGFYSKQLIEGTFENLDKIVQEKIDSCINGLIFRAGIKHLAENKKLSSEEKFLRYIEEQLDRELASKSKKGKSSTYRFIESSKDKLPQSSYIKLWLRSQKKNKK